MDLMTIRKSIIAQSSKILYDAHDLVFDGTNYIDTGVYLYSAENINKDFEIVLNIGADQTDRPQLQTIVASMDEHSPYPGFVIRRRSVGSDYQVSGANAIVTNNNWPVSEVMNRDIHFRREGTFYTAWVDGYGKVFSSLSAFRTTVFDIPIVLGAGLDGNLNPFRFWKGTINHIRIAYI